MRTRRRGLLVSGFLLLCSAVLLAGPVWAAGVLYDNGPLVTHPGEGDGGLDVSVIAVDGSFFGWRADHPGFSLADDFQIPAGESWHLDEIRFHSYQTGGGTGDIYAGAYFRIWDGRPDLAGSQVVFGDLTTNRMIGAAFTGIYRTNRVSLTNVDRAIMGIDAAAGVTLSAGTYWLEWQLEPDAGGTTPWVPPVTVEGLQGKPGANALVWVASDDSWREIEDDGNGAPQDLSFRIYGSVEVLYDNGPLVTHPGEGMDGLDVSTTAVDGTTYGWRADHPDYSHADDFQIPAGETWQLDKIRFHFYQTGGGTGDIFAGAYFRIWDGRPDEAGSQVVFGDLDTNRMIGAAFTGIYRTSKTDLTNTNRAIMGIDAAAGFTLSAGTYWLEWQLEPNPGGTTPWGPPVTIEGLQGKPGANALIWNASNDSWGDLKDSASDVPQDLPFWIFGSILEQGDVLFEDRFEQ